MHFGIDTNRLQESIRSIERVQREKADSVSASGMHKRLVELINDFEKNLDPEFEAGARLVSFGQTVQFHIIDVGYYNPNIIIFWGILEDGSYVKLLQHMSQLSVLLVQMKRKNPDEPRRKIGFCPENQDEEEVIQACEEVAVAKESPKG